jgi:gliding motility-associated-like protein
MGCTDTTEENIQVQGDLIIYIPNAFTPNNDQLNNLFCPVGTFIDKDEYTFRIFDRWGKIVFFSNKPGEGWDGMYNEAEASEGMYSYQLNCRDLAGKKHQRKGSVSLIR